MQIFIDQSKQVLIKQKYLFIDTNILSELSRNPDLLDLFVQMFEGRSFLISPYIRFEFLRDTFLAEAFEIKKEFIDSEDYFLPDTNHQQIFLKTQENALMLSKVFAHQNMKAPPLVDLLLIGRVMMFKDACIITSDFADFPMSMFNRLNVISYDVEKKVKNKNGSEIQKFQIIEFDETKLSSCINSMDLAQQAVD